MVRLDDENLKDVDLIKIDVQGWELEVLQGAEEIIKKQHPWVIFEVNQDIDTCCKFMEDLGYETIHTKSKIWHRLGVTTLPSLKSIIDGAGCQ